MQALERKRIHRDPAGNKPTKCSLQPRTFHAITSQMFLLLKSPTTCNNWKVPAEFNSQMDPYGIFFLSLSLLHQGCKLVGLCVFCETLPWSTYTVGSKEGRSPSRCQAGGPECMTSYEETFVVTLQYPGNHSPTKYGTHCCSKMLIMVGYFGCLVYRARPSLTLQEGDGLSELITRRSNSMNMRSMT